MKSNKLLFIPDISGFTKFITETEITHSHHIITELINLIIEENNNLLKISEIEGDAILFYQDENIPSHPDMINLSEQMFTKFHTHLKLIENNTVCRCGACSTVSNLSLKFVMKYGEFQVSKIANFTKLFGSDVILVHRLLKNSIGLNEYIVSTEDAFAEAVVNSQGFIRHSEHYDNFGDVKLFYKPLTALKKDIDIFTPETSNLLKNSVANLAITIDQKIEEVYMELIDSDSKLKWVPDIKGVNNSSPINRIGASHICIFEDKELNFQTVAHNASGGKLSYTEITRLEENTSVNFEYSLSSLNETTKIELKIIPNEGVELSKEMIQNMTQTMSESLRLFKEYCENMD